MALGCPDCAHQLLCIYKRLGAINIPALFFIIILITCMYVCLCVDIYT